ncbi:MAG: hypothetical protein R6X29_05280 [Acidimicrobiia bacterium]|jgi:hypothetical protein
MRLQRIILIGVWALVSLLAVAGFAAFSSGGEAVPADSSPGLDTAVGRQAGAVAAMGFSGTAGAPAVATSTTAAPAQVSGADAEERPATSGTPYLRGETLSQLEVRELVSRYFAADDVNRAMRVAWCSSGFNPGLVDPETGAVGLFPMNPVRWSALADAAGFGGSMITDAEANVAVAAHLVEQEGWGAWACRG